VKRALPLALVIAGLAAAALGWKLLPPARGSLEYTVAVLDPRPPAQAVMPDGLMAVGAIRALVAEPGPGAASQIPVLLLPGVSSLVKSPDSELGRVPAGGSLTPFDEPGPPRALAGADVRVGLGPLALGGARVEVIAVLASLGPVFDPYLLLDSTEQTRRLFRAPEWQLSVRYLLVTNSWEEQRQAVAMLSAEPEDLPVADAVVLSPGRPPALRPRVRLAVALALLAAGILVMGLAARGLGAAELKQRFRPS